jgi:hypothetical protein
MVIMVNTSASEDHQLYSSAKRRAEIKINFMTCLVVLKSLRMDTETIWPSPHNGENRIFPNTATCQTTWHHTSVVHSLDISQLEVHFKITGQCDHVMYHVAPLTRDSNLGNVSTV